MLHPSPSWLMQPGQAAGSVEYLAPDFNTSPNGGRDPGVSSPGWVLRLPCRSGARPSHVFRTVFPAASGIFLHKERHRPPPSRNHSPKPCMPEAYSRLQPSHLPPTSASPGPMITTITAAACEIHVPDPANCFIMSLLVTTTKSHGWRLLPVAANRPASTIFFRSSFGISSVVKRRTLRRLRIVSSVSTMSSCLVNNYSHCPAAPLLYC